MYDPPTSHRQEMPRGCLIGIIFLAGLLLGGFGVFGWMQGSLPFLPAAPSSANAPTSSSAPNGPITLDPEALAETALAVELGDLMAELAEETSTAGRFILGGAVLLTDRDAARADAFFISRGRESDDRLSYVNLNQPSERWLSEATFGTNSTVRGSGETLFVLHEAQLTAIERRDGTTRWTADLSDKAACNECLGTVEGGAALLTADGIIAVYEATTGRLRWSVRLNATPRQFLVLSDRLVVPDDIPGEGSASGLRSFALGDGSETHPPVAPLCDSPFGREPGGTLFDPLLLSADGQQIYRVTDMFASCVTQIDVATMSQTWDTTLDDYYLRYVESEEMVLNEAGLHLSGEGGIVQVSPSGEVRMLSQADDYELRPISGDGATILAVAERQRGSNRTELWAIDAASGEQRWSMVIDEGPGGGRIRSPDDYGGWAAWLANGEISLVEVIDQGQGERAMRYRRLARSDGSEQVRVEFAEGTILRGLTWDRQFAYLSADELYLVELTSGEAERAWP